MNTINYSSESFPAQVASGGIAMGKALIIGKKAFLERGKTRSPDRGQRRIHARILRTPQARPFILS